MPDYNLLGSQDVLEELQEGRTRELLLLLQDRPVPEIVDPMNLQTINNAVEDIDGDYKLDDTEADGTSVSLNEDSTTQKYSAGFVINPNADLSEVTVTATANTTEFDTAYIEDSSDETILSEKTGPFSGGDTITFDVLLSADSEYVVYGATNDESDFTMGYDTRESISAEDFDISAGWTEGGTGTLLFTWSDINVKLAPPTAGYVTDQFSAPTSAPAEFEAWNAIRAEGVTTGGSTSANPVEFEILDSTDSVLTSARIPASEIADSAFRLRDREHATTAGADGQADYQIPETGTGGHYGLPILSVVTVEQNGSVLDPSAWEFDGTDTVTIDTSSVSITSGDSITISYDFDVFDSTLQPRAYLSRESTTETSPSISHFRYEYVI